MAGPHGAREVAMARARCWAGQRVPARHAHFYYRELERGNADSVPGSDPVQDEHLVVVDKPHFLPMTPGGRFVQETLLTRLKKTWTAPN
jgi:hypothetical protein